MTIIEATPVPATPVPVSGRRSTMQVRKRNGDAEDVDGNKIVRAVERGTRDLDDVDPLRVATKSASCTTVPPPPSRTGCRSGPRQR